MCWLAAVEKSKFSMSREAVVTTSLVYTTCAKSKCLTAEIILEIFGVAQA